MWIRTDYVNPRFITVVLAGVAWLRRWHAGVVGRCVLGQVTCIQGLLRVLFRVVLRGVVW